MTEPAATADDGWFDHDTSGETLSETAARGGALSKAGRREAIGAALRLLGQYFASGAQPLSAQRALSHRERRGDADPELSALLAGLRLRVALAAAERLRAILRRIVDRATFRYQLQPVESIGQLTGQLDINRYLARLGERGDVSTYPIFETHRTERTPENLLAAYSARWLLREMRTALAGSNAPTTGPEYRQYTIVRRDLERMLRLPGLVTCVPKASQVNRRRAEQHLVETVKRRLRRREIPNATPYAELVSWLDRALSGEPVAEPGELNWSFYGDRFDTKLFELWCLHRLAGEVSRQLAAPVPPLDLKWRAGNAAYTWHRLAGTLSLHFQRSLTSISSAHPPRWRRIDGDGKALGGVPDIVVQAVRREEPQKQRFAVIDPKLRQRSGPPVDELYKILGYLANFDLAEDPLGAILFHTTETNGLGGYEYTMPGKKGTLYAIRLNPVTLSESQQALAVLATALLGLLEIPPLVSSATVSMDPDVDPEETAEAYLRARRTELVAYGENLPLGVLNTSRHRVAAALGEERWRLLTTQVQTMLATADHVGFSVLADTGGSGLDGPDFSGPVIGVCTSVESVLHEHVIAPATAHDPALAEQCARMTLGTAITLMEQAAGGVRRPRREHSAVRARFSAQGIDPAAVADLIAPLRELNRRFRTPAAHRSLLRDGAWLDLWKTVMGEGRLLAHTIDTFVLSPAAEWNDADQVDPTD